MREEKIFVKRYLLIDGIRGFAITNMVIFHFLYDVYIIYRKNSSWYSQPHIHIWQQAICWTFIFVSGFVWQLAMKNNFRRGIFFNMRGIMECFFLTLPPYLSIRKNFFQITLVLLLLFFICERRTIACNFIFLCT